MESVARCEGHFQTPCRRIVQSAQLARERRHGIDHPQLPIGHAHLLADGGEHAGRQDAPGVGESS